MDSSSSISRIYDLKTIGVQQVIGDIDAIKAKFEQLSAAKRSLSDAKGNIYDPAVLSQVTAQIDKLNELQGQTIGQLKELNATTKQGVTAQGEYAAAVLKSATEQKGANVVMDQAAAAMGNNLSASAAGVTKMQAVVSGAARSIVDYDAALGALAAKMQQLRGDTESINAEFKLLESQLKAGSITGEAYTEATIALTAELSQNKAQIAEVTSAMGALNKVYNPALLEEENAVLALNKVELQERNKALKQEAQSILSVEGSVKSARAEIALLNAEQERLVVLKTAGVAITDKEIAANIKRRDEIIAEKNALHEFIAENADSNLARVLNIGKYPNPTAEMRDIISQLGKLITAGQQGSAEFQKLSARAKELRGEMIELKAATTEATTVGDKLTTMAERMGLRLLLNIFIFQASIEAASAIYQHTIENIHGTEAYTAKQKELTDAMNSQNDVLTKQIEKYTESAKAKNLYFDAGESSFKRELDRIKAIGAVDGELYKFQKEQLNAEQELRSQQIDDLNSVKNKYSEVQEIFLQYDKRGDLGGAKRKLKALGLAPEDLKEFNSQIDQYVVARGKLDKADRANYKLAENDTLFKKQSEIQGKLNNLASDSLNAEAALQASLQQLTYTKGIELKEHLYQLDEQYRQLRGKEDAASVDKIVADTSAKYGMLIHGIEKQLKELQKHYPDGILPDALQTKYDAILAKFRKQQAQDIANQQYELAGQQYSNFNTTETSLASGSAGLAKGSSDFGAANYGRMVEALDKETEAKKTAINNQFKSQAAAINDSGQLIELQKQKDAQIEQVDKDSYKKRLGFATDYFKRLSENTIQASDIIIKGIDTATTNKLTAILTGKGSNSSKERRMFYATQKGIVDKSNATISEMEGLLPGAKQATDKAKTALDEAKGEDAKTEAKKRYNEALNNQADIEGKLADALNARANAEQRIKEKDKELRNQIIDKMIGAAEKIANSYMDLLQKEDAYRQTMAQRALDYNTRQQQALAQSKQEQIANEKAHDAAQRQLEKQRMQDATKRAQQQLTISYVVALAKGLEKGFPEAAIEEAAATVEFAFAMSQLSKAPAYAGGTSNHPGGWAWVGDGGENELIKIGNQLSMSPNTATPVNLPAGAQVIPMSHITQYSGTMGGQLRPPAFQGGSSSRSSDYGAAFDSIHATMHTVMQGVANIKVIQQDAAGIKTSINKSHFKRVSI